MSILEPTNNKATKFIEKHWPGVDSKFRLVILASLRNKQLLQGARSRLAETKLKHRSTRIAVEEVKQGLVAFTTFEVDLGAKLVVKPAIAAT